MVSEILIEGLIYSIMVLGVFSTYRVLDFCDMTVDGSFPLGACVLAICLINGVPVFPALILAVVAGILAGVVTSLIYTKLHIPDLLAGILTMTMLYSVNLRVLKNTANVSFLRTPTMFSKILDFMYDKFPSINPEWGIVFVLLIVVLVLKFLLDIFYHTDLGLTMGALGSNQQLIISMGINPNILRTIGICMGNGMSALAGAFAAMYLGFADVGMGTGTVVAGLASLMLGEFVIHSNKIVLQTGRVLLGSIIYRALMIIARYYGHYVHLTPNDFKLVTGILIIICLIITKTNVVSRIKNACAARKEGVAK